MSEFDITNLAEQYKIANQKETIAPYLEQSAPPEYYEMLDCLRRGQKWTGPVSAVRGFHFSPKVLTEITTQGGELYFFPQRPTLSQSEQIAKLSTSASGWDKRRGEVEGNSQDYKGAFCYAITPDETMLGSEVTVEPNADYFGLKGLRVVAGGLLKWKIEDKRIV